MDEISLVTNKKRGPAAEGVALKIRRGVHTPTNGVSGDMKTKPPSKVSAHTLKCLYKNTRLTHFSELSIGPTRHLYGQTSINTW